MNMRRVSEQKGATFAKMVGHAVMHMIGRKPVHFLDGDLELFNGPPTDIIEFERIRVFGTLVPDCTDKSYAPFTC